MTRLLTIALLCLILALPAEPAKAKVIKYVDANGVTVFVDDESRVPAEHRGKTQVYREIGRASCRERV